MTHYVYPDGSGFEIADGSDATVEVTGADEQTDSQVDGTRYGVSGGTVYGDVIINL